MTKIYLETLGCNKNDYDSEVLMSNLISEGFEIVNNPNDSDYMILNTCGFINDAKQESIERIFDLVSVKGDKKNLIVTGCLSQRYHDELVKEIPEVDAFYGVNDYDRIASELQIFNFDNKDRVGTDIDKLPYRNRKFTNKPHVGYLKIAEGCNNACAFCAIPSIRGPYRSKRIEDCVREANDMANAGIKELILIAEDTSQYGKDLYGELKLSELLKELCKIDGIKWIRLLYVYDNSINDELIETIATEEKICKYIDMPIQHISDNVLNKMKRQSNGKSIIETISKLRHRIPDIHIRTTILVGFPGETDKDIDELLEFIDSTNIDRLGAFSFSNEEGTVAFDLPNKIDEYIKLERRDLVMQHQLLVSEKLNEKKIGKTFDVIIDETLEENLYVGRTKYDAPDIDCEVTFTSNKKHQIGDIVKVKINDAYEYDLEGEEI